MPIQVQVFNPLEHKHYQLAKTQSEYDEDAKRQMAIDNNRMAGQGAIATMHEANQNNRANAAIMERRRQDATEQGNFESKQDALIAQQGIDNDFAQQRINNDQQRNANIVAQQGIDNQFRQSQDARLQAEADRQATDFSQAQEFKNKQLAASKFAGYLFNSSPDETGNVDVTSQKDLIKTFTGNDVNQDFKSLTARNMGDKTLLIGVDKDGKEHQLYRPISNNVLMAQSLFGFDNSKSAKEQAELEQTQLENKTKQAELDYMTKNGFKMGAAGQEKQNVTISTNQIGGSNILNKDEGTLTVTDPKGKIISTTKIPGVGAANQAAQGVDIQQPPGPQKMTAQQAYEAALSSGDKGRAERIKQMAMQRGDWQ